MRSPSFLRAAAAACAIAASGTIVPGSAAAQPLDGATLMADVQRYQSFGAHRYGSPGAQQAFDWIAGELRAAGFSVSDQPFDMGRQYLLRRATLTVGGHTLEVRPQWWLPESQPTVRITAPIAAACASAEGRIARLSVPFDQGAYLTAAHRAALETAFARKPAAVLLTIEHPSGEPYHYNVGQDDKPWPAPVPVILMGTKQRALLDAAEAAGTPVTTEIDGELRRGVPGRNVIGRLDRGSGRTIVVSTPVTGWDVNTCERGTGIAGFLAMARIARERLPGVDLVFVATAGHEIGHGGMEVFLRDAAPKPAAVAAWAHFGASLACVGWKRDGDHWVSDRQVDARLRLLNSSESLAPLVEQAFADVAAQRRIGAQAAIGELREVHAAGYANFFGIAGLHLFFHTPADNAATTNAEILEPVVHAYAETLSAVAAKR